MTTKTCLACASSNPADAEYCIQCGSPFPLAEESISAPMPAVPSIDQELQFALPSTTVEASPQADSTTSVQLENFSSPVETVSVEENKELPCIVRLIGSFFGCLFGLIIGLCMGLICVLPIAFLITQDSNNDFLLVLFIILTIFLAFASTLLGILYGPGFLGKILTSIGDTFKWMTGSKK